MRRPFPRRSSRRRPGPARLTTVVVLAATVLAGPACSSSGEEASTPAPTATGGNVQAAPSSTSPASPSADGILRIGSLLPGTGSQAALGPAMAAAAQAAIDDLNAAGGFGDTPIEYVAGDSGDVSTDTAAATIERLVAEKVDVVVGPASAGVADAVADQVATAGLVLVSPANPLPLPPAGLRYVHTAPTATLRGKALAAEVLAGRARNVVVLSREDGFGQRLGSAVREPLAAAGVTVTSIEYNPEAEVYTADGAEAAAVRPDAVVIVGYAETVAVVKALAAAGVTPATVPIWLLTDRLDDSLTAGQPQPALMVGVRGVVPAVELPAAFAARIRPGASPPRELAFTAETYDAVVLAALAATRAGTDDPAKFASAFTDATAEAAADCTTPAECLAAIADGPVNYVGLAGPYRFDDTGAPTAGRFAVRSFGAGGTIDPAQTVYRTVTG